MYDESQRCVTARLAQCVCMLLPVCATRCSRHGIAGARLKEIITKDHVKSGRSALYSE